MANKNRQFRATGGVSKQSLRALDWLNFFLSDVRDGIGPYLGIYLLATHHWDAGSIGIAMSAMGFATVVAQTPAGALIDSTRWKRLIMAVASLTIALCCILMTIFVNLPVIIFFQVLMGIAAAVLMPAVTAITLGLVGYRKYPERQGRNEMFNHAGNVTAAAVAGLLGHFIAPEWLFYAVAIFAIGSIVSVLKIRDKDIDNELARGAKRGEDDETVHISGFMAVLGSKPLLVFALAIILFHFANAAMLPLVGQYLTVDANSGAALYMSACIIVAQLVMIPVAKFAGAYADIWGRRPVFQGHRPLCRFARRDRRGDLDRGLAQQFDRRLCGERHELCRGIHLSRDGCCPDAAGILLRRRRNEAGRGADILRRPGRGPHTDTYRGFQPSRVASRIAVTRPFAALTLTSRQRLDATCPTR